MQFSSPIVPGDGDEDANVSRAEDGPVLTQERVQFVKFYLAVAEDGIGELSSLTQSRNIPPKFVGLVVEDPLAVSAWRRIRTQAGSALPVILPDFSDGFIDVMAAGSGAVSVHGGNLWSRRGDSTLLYPACVQGSFELPTGNKESASSEGQVAPVVVSGRSVRDERGGVSE